MILLPSSPLSSVEPNPGRKIPAQRANTISSAVTRVIAGVFATRGVLGKFFPLLIFTATVSAEPLPKPVCEHVLLVVWDGMRPDFIREDLTPNAWSLVKRGTFFARNHSSYITTTEVNGTTIATGMKPHHHGIFANSEYRPDVNITFPIATQDALSIRVGDALRGGKWLLAPTIAETVRKAGGSTAIAGTKEVALLHDRTFDRTGAAPHIFQGKTRPLAHLKSLTVAIGPWPKAPADNAAYSAGQEMPDGWQPSSNTAQNRWTTRALVEHEWKDAIPRFSTLWLSDPDYSQHFTEPGSPTALAAIQDSDRHLGLALAELEKRGVLEKTNVFLVSDHAFSTLDRPVALGKRLASWASSTATKRFTVVSRFRGTPRPEEVLLITTGGSSFFYVQRKDPIIIAEIVDWLQRSDFAGPVFTKDGASGTFKFSDVLIDTPDAPDVVVSASWSGKTNAYNVPGLLAGDGRLPGGTHGSLSEWCIRNTLIAAGPDIRRGFRDELPSGNVDVAPTILHLLGITPTVAMDGRILAEALDEKHKPPVPETKRIETTRELGDGKTWKQYLQFTTLGDAVYLDQGNSNAAQ